MQVGNFGDAPTLPEVSITGDFSETDNCSVAVAGGQKCDINVVFMPTVTEREPDTHGDIRTEIFRRRQSR